MTVGVKQDVDSLNPYTGVTVAAYEAWTLVYDSLLNLSDDGLKPIPELATEVPKAGDDGLTWTYKLRDDVKWSDGTPFTAERRRPTRSRACATRSGRTSRRSSAASSRSRLPTRRPSSSRPRSPTRGCPYIPVYILQKKQWSKISTDDVETFANTKMVGTGPFTLTQYKKGQFATFAANKDYFGGCRRPRRDPVPRLRQRRDDGRRAEER